MRILMYHDIVSDTPREVHDVSVAQFAAQMSWLDETGYQVVSAESWAAARTSKEPLPANAVAITFDDGFENTYHLAWPILQRHRFPATVFLVTGALAGTSAWRHGALAATSLLSRRQILQMAQGRIGFGSHTVTHTPLTDLTTVAAIDRELVVSKAALEQLLDREVVSLCYPFSRVNAEIRQRVQMAGYELAFTYDPGYVGSPGHDPFQLRRTGILATDTLETFAHK
ncbi:MAG: polysaccharide deacetylase family protein, partial [Thiohalospira sp.]